MAAETGRIKKEDKHILERHVQERMKAKRENKSMTIADKIRTLDDFNLMLLITFGYVPSLDLEIPDEVDRRYLTDDEKTEAVKEWLRKEYKENENDT